MRQAICYVSLMSFQKLTQRELKNFCLSGRRKIGTEISKVSCFFPKEIFFPGTGRAKRSCSGVMRKIEKDLRHNGIIQILR